MDKPPKPADDRRKHLLARMAGNIAGGMMPMMAARTMTPEQIAVSALAVAAKIIELLDQAERDV